MMPAAMIHFQTLNIDPIPEKSSTTTGRPQLAEVGKLKIRFEIPGFLHYHRVHRWLGGTNETSV
jgi:hypothetical protein